MARAWNGFAATLRKAIGALLLCWACRAHDASVPARPLAPAPMPTAAPKFSATALSLVPADTLTWGRTLEERRSYSAGTDAQGNPIPSRVPYESTHAREVPGIFAPYLAPYAELNGIDLKRLESAIFPNGLPIKDAAAPYSIFLSSAPHMTGNWTFYLSASVLVYEVIKVRAQPSGDPFLVVLFTESIPPKIIVDTFDADWSLATVDMRHRVVSLRPFHTHIPYPDEGIWDMITTGLALRDGKVEATIEYTHTGSGGGRDQGFRCTYEATEPLLLDSGRCAQFKDAFLH